jgi:hypothetical protein
LAVTQGRVRAVIRRWAGENLPEVRRIAAARQLGRLDLMLATVLPLACSRNFKAVTAACKIINLQNLILGINQPNAPVVQIDVPRPPTATDRIQRVLEALAAQPRDPQLEADRILHGDPEVPRLLGVQPPPPASETAVPAPTNEAGAL